MESRAAVVLLAAILLAVPAPAVPSGEGFTGEAWEVQLQDVRAVSWSPDGGLLAVGAGHEVLLLDQGESVAAEVDVGEEVLNVAWLSPSSVVAATTDGLLLAHPEPSRLLGLPHPADFALAETSPAGGLLAVAWGWARGLDVGGLLAIVDSSGAVVTMQELPSPPSDVDWRPDGSSVAVGTEGGYTLVFSSSGRREWMTDVRSARQFANTVRSVRWTPNGTFLTEGLGPRFVDFLRAETGGLAGYFPVAGMPAGLDWTPDGRLLCVGAGGRVEVLTASGEVVWESEEFISPPEVVGWSPDGGACLAFSIRWAMAVTPDGEVIWFAGPFRERLLEAEWSPVGESVALAWESGVGVFAAGRQLLDVRAAPIALAGPTPVEIRFFNPLPWPEEVNLSVEAGPSGWSTAEEAPPGWSSWNVTLDLPPGEVEISAGARTALGESSAGVEVTVLLPMEVNLTAWAQPGLPAAVRAYVENPNPGGVNCTVSLLVDGGAAGNWSGVCPYGWIVVNWTVDLDPGPHELEASVRFLGVEVSSGPVFLTQPVDSIEVTVGPAGFLAPARVPVSVGNPAASSAEFTLEVWVDGALVSTEEVSLGSGEEETYEVELGGGTHSVYARAVWSGWVLGEAEAEVSLVPIWVPVAAGLALITVVAAAAVRRRGRGSAGGAEGPG